MKKTFPILLNIFIMLTTVAVSQPKPARVIFFGDSITELGVKPGGYITKIKEALEKKGVAGQYELIGAGISGNKVYDLYLRLEEDVLSKIPDVVVIYVGVNDVWHKTVLGTGTDADKFEKFYAAIIKKLQENNIKLILCTPAVIGERTDNSNQQDGDLNLYSQIIRNLAEQYRCSLCDLRKAFLEYNLKNNSTNSASGILTTDKVHLNEKGNQLVADLLLAELYSN
ncbi:GDSL-type esterase/lipase family protein [candidate division KSB1 bacterium]|nr:GDSL-type esterase/lipase family protein [candidate division KSB1 bacterium]